MHSNFNIQPVDQQLAAALQAKIAAIPDTFEPLLQEYQTTAAPSPQGETRP